jgi:hypothetical protein
MALEGVPPEKLDPRDDDGGTSDHCVERFESLLFAEPHAPLDQELRIGLDCTEIDVFRIPSWHGWVVIVWHVGFRQF